MFQKGDLLWIPAGTMLHRPRIPGKDDLFSNWFQTTKPTVALFLKFEGYDNSIVMMSGKNWSVKTREIRHNVTEDTCVS